MSPTTTTANGNSTVPTTSTTSTTTSSTLSYGAIALKQRNVSKDLGTNTLLLDLCTPPKFETIAEDRAYLKERLAAAFRIFAKLGLDYGIVRYHTHFLVFLIPSTSPPSAWAWRWASDADAESLNTYFTRLATYRSEIPAIQNRSG